MVSRHWRLCLSVISSHIRLSLVIIGTYHWPTPPIHAYLFNTTTVTTTSAVLGNLLLVRSYPQARLTPIVFASSPGASEVACYTGLRCHLLRERNFIPILEGRGRGTDAALKWGSLKT